MVAQRSVSMSNMAPNLVAESRSVVLHAKSEMAERRGAAAGRKGLGGINAIRITIGEVSRRSFYGVSQPDHRSIRNDRTNV